MSRFVRYFLSGMRSGMIVGVPDFRTNNQYTDMVNIGNDMRVSIKRTISGQKDGKASRNRDTARRAHKRSKYSK